MNWDAQLYDKRHSFVGAYGKALLHFVNRSPGQRILDLGCGTGALSGMLAERGAEVIGADLSEEMLALAKRRLPRLHFVQGDAASLPFEEEFDTVFSNAVFHWIPDQEALLAGIFRMLKPGGALVFEMGAKGCGLQIEKAFERQAERVGYPFHRTFYFPDSGIYESLLQGAGFAEIQLSEFDRPTPLEGGKEGLRNWVRQFYENHLAAMPPASVERVLRGLEEELFPILWDGEQWVADYRRLRGTARKPHK